MHTGMKPLLNKYQPLQSNDLQGLILYILSDMRMYKVQPSLFLLFTLFFDALRCYAALIHTFSYLSRRFDQLRHRRICRGDKANAIGLSVISSQIRLFDILEPMRTDAP